MSGHYFVSQTVVDRNPLNEDFKANPRALKSAADGFRFMLDKIRPHDLRQAVQKNRVQLYFMYGDDPYNHLKVLLSPLLLRNMPDWFFFEPEQAAIAMCNIRTIRRDVQKVFDLGYFNPGDFKGLTFPEPVLTEKLHWRVSMYDDEQENYLDVIWTLSPSISTKQAVTGLLSIQRFLDTQENPSLHGKAREVADALRASKIDPVFKAAFVDLSF